MKHEAERNHCFGCGKDNPEGMHLEFCLQEEPPRAISNFTLTSKYSGPPGYAHGGIIATILDEAMSKVNKLRRVLAMTRKMEIEYLKPVPLDRNLRVVAVEKYCEGRKHTNVAEIQDEVGTVLARGEALFIAIDPARISAAKIATEP